jgi:hypothetical protein
LQRLVILSAILTLTGLVLLPSSPLVGLVTSGSTSSSGSGSQAVGTFGGLIPGWRVSRMNPVEAGFRRS